MGNAAVKLPETTETTTELVVINSTPAKVEFNIEELRTKVREALEPYDIVVTADTVKGAKELMADLNKKAKSIKDVFKDAAKQATAQVDEQGEQVAALAQEIIDARTKLKSQVDTFEADRKEEARKKLIEKQAELWESEGIQDEFRRSDATKLVTLTCLTAKNALTSGTMTKLKDLIAGDKNLQTQTEHRLLTLENESFKAGLKAVLTRDHVEAFLFADPETYKQRLSAMLESERRRQEATEAAARQQFEQEQAKQQEVQQREQAKQQESQAKQAPVEQASAKATPPQPTAAELREKAAELRVDANYCDDKAGYRSYMDSASKLEAEAAELEKQEAAQQQANTSDYLLCSIHDTKDVVQLMKSSDFNEVTQAALSASHGKSSEGQPYYVAIWERANGRVAIVDGLSGDVYQRVSA